MDFAYPRPQLQRANWTSLNGPWRFRYDDDQAFNRPQDIDHWPQQITVPFPPESKASGINDRGFHKVCWYQRDFDIKPGRERVMLRFGAMEKAWKGDRLDPKGAPIPGRGKAAGSAPTVLIDNAYCE